MPRKPKQLKGNGPTKKAGAGPAVRKGKTGKAQNKPTILTAKPATHKPSAKEPASKATRRSRRIAGEDPVAGEQIDNPRSQRPRRKQQKDTTERANQTSISSHPPSKPKSRTVKATNRGSKAQERPAAYITPLTEQTLSNLPTALPRISDWREEVEGIDHYLSLPSTSMPPEESQRVPEGNKPKTKSNLDTVPATSATKFPIGGGTLIAHHIDLHPSTGTEQDQDIADALSLAQNVEIKFSDTKALQRTLSTFLEKAKTEETRNAIPDLKALYEELGKHRAGFALLPSTNSNFAEDLKHARLTNEAIFQRTAMMSIFDRWHVLGAMFVYTSEALWYLDPEVLMPNMDAKKVLGNKPDLLISFKWSSLGNEYTIPLVENPLKCCIDPERSDGKRCFPFLVVEGKEAYKNLEAGFHKNLYRAAQLLSNMFTWFAMADELEGGDDCTKHRERFFTDVRVFTVTLNANEFWLCSHRATPHPKTTKIAQYDYCETLVIPHRYDLDQVGHAVATILRKYVSAELQSALAQAIDAVAEGLTRRDNQYTRKKRKADTEQAHHPGTSSKRRASDRLGTAQNVEEL